MISLHTKRFLEETAAIATTVDAAAIDAMVTVLKSLQTSGGRLFIVGSGGGAGHASHAVCDFRKLCGLEAYTPSDNVSELTARVNDESWAMAYAGWLAGSRIRAGDVLLVFSVGGGDAERNISANLVEAVKLAKSVGAQVIGVVGRDGGYTKQVADACVVIPTMSAASVTPHTEGWQAVVWHLLVSHPDLQRAAMKWESTAK